MKQHIAIFWQVLDTYSPRACLVTAVGWCPILVKSKKAYDAAVAALLVLMPICRSHKRVPWLIVWLVPSGAALLFSTSTAVQQ